MSFTVDVSLLSQFIPPSPSPTVPTSLFSMSASPLLPSKKVHQYHLSRFHLYINIWYLFSSFWFTSLFIIGSRFIHIIRTDSNVFLFMVEWYITIASLSIWKVAAASHVLHRDSWPPEERISIRGQRWGLTTCSFLCSKVLLKCNRDRENFWHRHQKGKERVPLC